MDPTEDKAPISSPAPDIVFEGGGDPRQEEAVLELAPVASDSPRIRRMPRSYRRVKENKGLQSRVRARQADRKRRASRVNTAENAQDTPRSSSSEAQSEMASLVTAMKDLGSKFEAIALGSWMKKG